MRNQRIRSGVCRSVEVKRAARDLDLARTRAERVCAGVLPHAQRAVGDDNVLVAKVRTRERDGPRRVDDDRIRSRERAGAGEIVVVGARDRHRPDGIRVVHGNVACHALAAVEHGPEIADEFARRGTVRIEPALRAPIESGGVLRTPCHARRGSRRLGNLHDQLAVHHGERRLRAGRRRRRRRELRYGRDTTRRVDHGVRAERQRARIDIHRERRAGGDRDGTGCRDHRALRRRIGDDDGCALGEREVHGAADRVVNVQFAPDRVGVGRSGGRRALAHPLRGEICLNGLAVGIGQHHVEHNQFREVASRAARVGLAVAAQLVGVCARGGDDRIDVAVGRRNCRARRGNELAVLVERAVLHSPLAVVRSVRVAVEVAGGVITEPLVESTGGRPDRHRLENRPDSRDAREVHVDLRADRAHQVGGNAVRDAERTVVRHIGCRRASVGGKVLPLRDVSEGLVLEHEVRGIRCVQPNERLRLEVRRYPRGSIVGGHACRDDGACSVERGCCGRSKRRAVVHRLREDLRDVKRRIDAREERRGRLGGKPFHGDCRVGNHGRSGGKRNGRICCNRERRTGEHDRERRRGIKKRANAIAHEANCGG